MSLFVVEEIVRELPAKLRDDVVGYARSVEAALPEIFRDAGISPTQGIADQLVFIAGVRKLYSICSSNYWILENSLRALAEQSESVRLGSTVISRGSPYLRNLQQLHSDLQDILKESALLDFMEGVRSYSEIARRIAGERPGNRETP